jgi:hypothetical protein
MRQIVVNNNVTLDGVMQAPARPDEDRRGDFEHGGWATPYFDFGHGRGGRRRHGGRRLFEGEGTFEKFQLVDTKNTTTGVIIATYRLSQ